ncbi:hypothetical protein F442_10771 [Phytophthora nicotianae P10297]|uniref:Uncharacterized protein n=1 Tax=Phytophthora nicotianae P10297 TaxID=1317064 RepID=W2Z5H6_PHYNI|nr:hypothetical protein F442_10771 [Phytophthora nicotianae P10297]
MLKSATEDIPTDGQDDAYPAQRQSVTDSAALGELLTVETNLSLAGHGGKMPSKESNSAPLAQATGLSACSSMPSTQIITSSSNFPASQESCSSPKAHIKTSATTQTSDDSAASKNPFMGPPSPGNDVKLASKAPSGSRTDLMTDATNTSSEDTRGSSSDYMEIPRSWVERARRSWESKKMYDRPETRDTSGSNKVRIGRSQSVHGGNMPGLNPLAEVTLLTFPVKKSDSVLGRLSNKRTSFQLHLDVEEKILYLLSAHDQHEEYSCATVTAKPQSDLGMQLKIQARNGSEKKKNITFYNLDDRDSFVHALESTRNSMIIDHFQLLPGESVLDQVHRVVNLVVISKRNRAVQGVLKVTSYRITFVPYDVSWMISSFELPRAAIDLIKLDGPMILLTCKDLRAVRLVMHDAYSRGNGYDQLPSTPNHQWLKQLALRMLPPCYMSALFACDYYKQRGYPIPEQHDGWFVYSPIIEYLRLGLLSPVEQPNEEGRITWRLLKNSKFRFSPTYPQLMVVPSLMSEEQLVQSARFRSRARLPVVVWRHPVNKSVLSRSSQPNYGMAGNRSEPDRILLRAYRDSANKNSSNMSPPLHIIDAHKPIATKGNRLKGKGVENSQHYDNATIEFMGIANIHKMRESLDTMKSLVSSSSVEDSDKHYHNRLENTRWLKHVMRVLSGARRVAEVLHEDGASVLVHCSDGWDRTPQLVTLAQLILDPFYRSIRGFASLVEKEWCSFGHKFADRIGVGKDIMDQPNERSPVMLLFLDCVWQMTRQFPTCFEFNEKFLIHISDSLISGLYGTFLYNSERERVLDKVWERTESAWTPVLENPGPYKNPAYRPTNGVLYPVQT